MRVYPHVCGAAVPQRFYRSDDRGLSPRVWGSLLTDSSVLLCERSIPTCVGQPPLATSRERLMPVYPHVCGAARISWSDPPLAYGLSPRVWGSQRLQWLSLANNRSIPTCVGQPCVDRNFGCVWAVYPHVCGAAMKDSAGAADEAGLSPRVWGSPCLQAFYL